MHPNICQQVPYFRNNTLQGHIEAKTRDFILFARPIAKNDNRPTRINVVGDKGYSNTL